MYIIPCLYPYCLYFPGWPLLRHPEELCGSCSQLKSFNQSLKGEFTPQRSLRHSHPSSGRKRADGQKPLSLPCLPSTPQMPKANPIRNLQPQLQDVPWISMTPVIHI